MNVSILDATVQISVAYDPAPHLYRVTVTTDVPGFDLGFTGHAKTGEAACRMVMHSVARLCSKKLEPPIQTNGGG
jgi:hypothetical protein